MDIDRIDNHQLLKTKNNSHTEKSQNGGNTTLQCQAQIHSSKTLKEIAAMDKKINGVHDTLSTDDNNDNYVNDDNHLETNLDEISLGCHSNVSRTSSSSSSVYHDTSSMASYSRGEQHNDAAVFNDSNEIEKKIVAKVQNTVERTLREIELSSEETRSRLGSDVMLLAQSKPVLVDEVCDESFTEVPLNSPSMKPANSYEKSPSKQTTKKENDTPPGLGDIKPKQMTRTLSSKLHRENSPNTITKEHKQISTVKTQPVKVSPDVQKKVSLATSTTGLIFENRPSHLPPKLAKEEEKHRQQYDNMMEKARKTEKKKVTKEIKQQQKQKKVEDNIGQLVNLWKSEILPNWENVKNTKRVKELWWSGLPPSIRGKVWGLALGNNLHITSDLFYIFRAHAADRVRAQSYRQPVATLHENDRIAELSKENTVGLIALDVARTFPSLCIFQKGGPYHDLLKDLLGAYTCYRPDVGYVQGMSFLAAMLLLNMDIVDAFISFTNLLNRPCQMAFFMVDQPLAVVKILFVFGTFVITTMLPRSAVSKLNTMNAYFETFDALLEEHLPRLQVHFKQENLSHDIYLIDWIFTLYSKSLPLDVSCRIWDLFCRDGEGFLFRAALGILRLYHNDLLEMEFFHLAQYLTKMSSKFTSNELFQSISAINFSTSRFNSLLHHNKSLVDRNKR